MKAPAPRSLKLSICILLPDMYQPGMPARPAVTEIYGDCLPGMGHKITWIMAAQESTEHIREETSGYARIFTIPYHPGSSLPGKVIAKLRFILSEKKLIGTMLKKGESVDIIQARNGIFEGLLAAYLKRRLGIPFVFQYSFPVAEWASQKHRLGHGRGFYLMARAERVALRFIMKRADLVLPIGPQMLEDLAKRGIAREKMMPLPLAVNPELFSPSVGGDMVRRKYELGDANVLVYLGTMDRLRQLDILIDIMARLRQAGRNVKMLMVGEGDDRSRLGRLAVELGVADDIVFTGQVPYFDVPQFIAAADVALSPVPPLDLYRVSSPCKLFEYMGVAKPVVANEEIPEHREVLEQSGAGLLVPFTADVFARAIIELLDHPDKAADMGRRGREWVVMHRIYYILARKVENAYYRILEEKE